MCLPMLDRLSLCNEVLMPMDFARQCAYASALGYRALEVAPYTLADEPSMISETQARQWAAIAADHGLAISGLHWLLVAPDGLSITSPDLAVWQRSRDFMLRLVELCAQMGGQYLVHGSPAQRVPQPGQSRADALQRASAAWADAGESAGKLGLHYCIEPLGPATSTLVNTVAEAVQIVRRLALPGLRTMLDTCSAANNEPHTPAELVDRWWPAGELVHVQLNDRNRRGPGQGGDDFAALLLALQRHGYAGWLAVEPFDYAPDGAGCAAHSAGYLRGLLHGIAAR
jgi:sugar phosphate isomerase/epimerase